MDFGIPDGNGKPRMECANVPRSIDFAVRSGLCRLHELQTIYGTEDLWDLIEMHAVNLHNQREEAKHANGH